MQNCRDGSSHGYLICACDVLEGCVSLHVYTHYKVRRIHNKVMKTDSPWKAGMAAMGRNQDWSG